MTFDADLIACADLVRRADADRFLGVMAAPVAARAVLFPLYALNVEVARAPWVTAEPMIAEMRLQWWRDALQEIAQRKLVRRHEIVTPLAGILDADAAEKLDDIVAARYWDINKDPFQDTAGLTRHIDQTSGTLMWVAARSLGQADEAVVRDFAFASGVANWLRAVPKLAASGRVPLIDGTASGVQSLARTALNRLEQARISRRSVSKQAAPALLAGWQAGALLRLALRDPGRVADGTLGQSGARMRLTLMARATSGRW